MKICPLLSVCLIVSAGASCQPTPAQEKSAPPSGPRPPASAGKAEPGQLQFWVGEWDVSDNGKKIATSSIQLIASGHAVLENYSQPGFSGKSLTFVDGVLGKWRQTWVDSQGRVSEFVGEFADGAMRFEGETHTADGKKTMRRMVLQPLVPEGVRHYSERSDDGGKTWVKVYDYQYTKRM